MFTVAREAAAKTGLKAGYRPDGTVLMALGGEPQPVAQPSSIHYHPLKSNDLAAAQRQLESLRQHGLPIHGLSPGWVKKHGLVGVDSLCLYTGPLHGEEAASEGWQDLLGADLPKLATVVYSPSDSEDDLRERLSHLHGCQGVLLLPRAQGDRVLVSDATTDGAQDMAFLAVARVSLPAHVHLRASWAALGWKMAQASLCFGTDELAGWGIEEQLAYSGRGRPASVVEAAEAVAGIREARREPVEVVRCDWAS